MEHSGFFNSVNGDRKYKAEDWANYFNSFITNGVFPNPGTNLQVIADGTSMTVQVQVGKGWINGYLYYNDSACSLPLAIADGATSRIDRIVMRFDMAGRQITVAVKQGTYATSPIAPTLEQDADFFELALADVYVGAGVASVTQANVTDQRMDTLLCGWVDSLIQADTTAIFNQYQAWYNQQTSHYSSDISALEDEFSGIWNTWFDGIKGQLSTDAAGNLQEQINKSQLFVTDIQGTVAYVTTDGSDNISRVDHKASDGTIVRSDVFTYATNLITEVRTLSTGETVTLKYHTDTLEIEVI